MDDLPVCRHGSDLAPMASRVTMPTPKTRCGVTLRIFLLSTSTTISYRNKPRPKGEREWERGRMGGGPASPSR